MKKKTNKTVVRLALVFVCSFFVMLFSLVWIITGRITFSVEGFALDHEDRLYVGTQSEIQVFENGQLVDRIEIPSSRGYVFTIRDGDQIVLSTSTKVYTMDLAGYILQSTEDIGGNTHNEISRHKKTFTSEKGDEYKLSNPFGRTRITKNKTEIVYKVDAFSLVGKTLFVLGAPMMLFSLGWILSIQSPELQKHQKV